MVDYVSTNALSMLGGDDYGDITADIAALDASVVHRTGNLNETINGVKTFTSDFVINNANTDIISSAGVNVSSSSINLNGALTVTNNGAPTMRLNGDNISGLYFAFHPEGTNTRRAYVGFPNGGVVNFVTSNEYTNGTISNIVNGVNKSLMTTTTTTLTNTDEIQLNCGSNQISLSTSTIQNTVPTIRNLITNSFTVGQTGVGYDFFTIGTSVNTYRNSIINNIATTEFRVQQTVGTNKLLITATGTVSTNGGHRIVSTGGDSEIEGTRIFNTFYTGGSFNVRFYNGSFSDAKCEINPTSTTLTNVTNNITSTTGNNIFTVNSGDGGNVLRAIGTGSFGGGYNSIIGRNNYYDANPGGHFIRTGASGSEVVKISVYPTTTYMDNTNVVFTMGDQFTVNCFANRIYCSAGGFHNLRVNGAEKMVINETSTTNTNNSISNWVGAGGFSVLVSGIPTLSIYPAFSSLSGGQVYFEGDTRYQVTVNGYIRNFHDAGSTSYSFNPNGTGASRWRLYDNYTTNTIYFLQGAAVNGVYLGNGANGWSAWSDERIKKNIKPIDTALTDILKLNPVFYNYKGDDDTQPERAGFIAQEVQQVYPDIINESNMDSGDIKNLLGLDMTNLVPYLVKAIQDLNKKLDEQALIIQELVLKTSSL